MRSEIVRSAFDSDDSEDEQENRTGPSTETDSRAKPQVKRSTLGLTGPLAEALHAEYDRVVLGELVLGAIGVVVPTGGGAWVPVVRRFVQGPEVTVQESAPMGGEMLAAPATPDLLGETATSDRQGR